MDKNSIFYCIQGSIFASEFSGLSNGYSTRGRRKRDTLRTEIEHSESHLHLGCPVSRALTDHSQPGGGAFPCSHTKLPDYLNPSPIPYSSRVHRPAMTTIPHCSLCVLAPHQRACLRVPHIPQRADRSQTAGSSSTLHPSLPTIPLELCLKLLTVTPCHFSSPSLCELRQSLPF